MSVSSPSSLPSKISVWLPPSAKVGPIVYEISEQPDIVNAAGTPLDGWIKPDEELILIRAGMAPTAKYHVLWHEVLHAMFEQIGREVDEGTIDALAFQMVGFMIENPGFLPVSEIVCSAEAAPQEASE